MPPFLPNLASTGGRGMTVPHRLVLKEGHHQVEVDMDGLGQAVHRVLAILHHHQCCHRLSEKSLLVWVEYAG
jgi:hypothetical protein